MIRPSSLSLARHCQYSAHLAAKFPFSSPNASEGNEVDRQITEFLAEGTPPSNSDAIKCVEWICRSFPLESEKMPQVEISISVGGGRSQRGFADLVVDCGDHIVVVDYKKRGQWDTGVTPGPSENLQLHAYAMTFKRPYKLCLLMFGDGLPVQPEWSELFTPEGSKDLHREITDLSAKDPSKAKPISGDHCRKCWQRVHCPQWTIPAFKESESPSELTRENFTDVLAKTQAMEEVARRNRQMLRHMVDTEGPIDIGSGQVYAMSMCKGRVTADTDAMHRDGIFERYAKTGTSYPLYRIRRKT